MRLTLTAILSFVMLTASGQHLYQLPKPLKEKGQLDAIIGPLTEANLKQDLRILWVYGYDLHHIAGAHDYVKVKDLMVGLLSTMKNVKVEEAFHFPTKQQFDAADLVVLYLHLPQLRKRHFKMFKEFISNGGGVVSLHETAIMRPASKGKALSECLGFAWNEGTSNWGAIFDKITIDNQHEIFRGFPDRLVINDEFYWDLYREESVRVLGSVRTGPGKNAEGPVPEDQLSKDPSPMFWTYNLGQGRVFGTTTGHHTFTYYDPEFRIVLFRAMAWASKRKADPFMPLVFRGITNEHNKVGTTDPMRYWEGKIREKQ